MLKRETDTPEDDELVEIATTAAVEPAGDDESEDSDEKDKSRPRLTEAQWAEIEAHYEYGTLTTGEILTKYGITHAAISKHIKRAAEKGRIIKKLSKRHLLAVKTAEKVTGVAATATAAEVSTFETKRRKRIEESRETLFLHSRNNQASLMKIQKQIADGAITPAAATEDLKALRHAEALIKTMVENRWRILDIELDVDEKALPKLVLEDLSDQDIQEIQARGAEDGDDDEEDFVDDLTKEETS